MTSMADSPSAERTLTADLGSAREGGEGPAAGDGRVLGSRGRPLNFYPEQVGSPQKNQERRQVHIGAPPHLMRQVLEQLEDHLIAINENTDEIHADHEAIWQLNQKVDKLFQIVEEMRSSLSATLPSGDERFRVEPLTMREQEVFLLLYMAEGFVSQREIARRLSFPLALVRQHLTSLMEKGVPLTRRGVGDDMFLRLDQSFKERQAKENVAGISEQLTLALATTGTF